MEEESKTCSLKEGDYVLLATKENLEYAGSYVGNMSISEVSGIVLFLGKKRVLAIWCADENIKDIKKVIDKEGIL